MNRIASLLLLVTSSVVLGQPVKWKLPPGEKLLHTVQAVEMEGEVQDWGLANLNIPNAWSKTKGKGIVVGVLDTGVMKNHRDLKNQILSAKDFSGSASGADDKNGHGTWCVGSIIAEENGWGMIGAAPGAKARVYKVLGDDGSGDTDSIAKAIRQAVDDGCDVLSMSLGGPDPDTVTPAALAYARSKGVIVICASGNEGPAENTIDYPGNYEGVIAVAAHDSNNRTADFSSRGKRVFISGPGVASRSTWPGAGEGQFSTISGTSMACPRVAALACLWCAGNPAIAKADRPAKFEEALRASATKPNNRTTSYGYGKPDAVKLLAYKSTPAPGVPIPGPVVNSIEITEADLSVSGLAKLNAAGFKTFSFVLKSGNGTTSGVQAKSVDPLPIGTAPGPDYKWRHLPTIGWGWVSDKVKE
jgi:subtilisin family serine protease